MSSKLFDERDVSAIVQQIGAERTGKVRRVSFLSMPDFSRNAVKVFERSPPHGTKRHLLPQW